MLATLRSLFSPRSARRSLDAAGGGRRWADDRRVPNAQGIQAGAGVVAARGQYLATNNATVARIVESQVADITGTGLKPRSIIESEPIRARLHRGWRAWTDIGDADGLTDFYGLEALLCRDMIVCGEGVAIRDTDPATGAPQYRRINPEQLDRSKANVTPGGYAAHGVEFDRRGRRVAYWIKPGDPADPRGLIQLAPVRIPASDVIHLFRPLVPGQVRGLSWLAPIIVPARELDGLIDAMGVRARVSALFAGIVTDADGTGVVDGDQLGSTVEATMEPGALVSLPPGKDVRFPAMPDQGGASELMKSLFRIVAAGAGVTYESATGDFSAVSYSSARAAQAEHRRFIEAVQHHTIVPMLCAPVWRAFVRWQVLTGGISAAAYSADRAAYEAADWITPGFQPIDPIKAAAADVALINAGLKSRAEAAAERGLDIEDLDRQLAADAARLSRLGVTLNLKRGLP